MNVINNAGGVLWGRALFKGTHTELTAAGCSGCWAAAATSPGGGATEQVQHTRTYFV